LLFDSHLQGPHFGRELGITGTDTKAW